MQDSPESNSTIADKTEESMGYNSAHASPCPSGELRCVDGRCITLSQLCDGTIDCTDHADEDNCYTQNIRFLSVPQSTRNPIVLTCPSIRPSAVALLCDEQLRIPTHCAWSDTYLTSFLKDIVNNVCIVIAKRHQILVFYYLCYIK